MIAENAINGLLQNLPHSCDHPGDPNQTRLDCSVSLGSIVASQNANIKIYIFHEIDDALHRQRTDVHMKIAQLQNGEPIEVRRQSRRDDVIRSDSNARGVSPPNPEETRQFEYGGDEPRRKRKILDMEEVQALTKNLSFVVSFDPEPLTSVERTEALTKSPVDFVVVEKFPHGRVIHNRSSRRSGMAD